MKRRTLLKTMPLAALWSIGQHASAFSFPSSGAQKSTDELRLANANHVIVEGAARFTVITSGCIRMEYAPNFGFVDAPTLFAIERECRFDQVTISRTAGALHLDTGLMKLTYLPDGKPFNAHNLKVQYNDGTRQFLWDPDKKNLQNLGGPVATLDGVGAPFPLPNGLLARDGWFLLDDSGQPILVNGWIYQRPGGGPHTEGEPSGRNPDLDWYLFAYGNHYNQAFQSLTAISGPAPMPRKEVHGSWYCRWYPYTTSQFREIVQGYRDHDFPLDILVMDMEWHTKNARYGFGHAGQLGWTGYTWNQELIPDPREFIQELRRNEIFVVLNDHPHDGIRDHEACYSHFKVLLGPGYPDNPPFDAGDPVYMKAFFEASHVPIENQGVDFWWVDWQQDYILPWVSRVPGLRHLPWLNQLYYQHSQRRVVDGETLRGQGFSRWGGWGDHRHPIQFSGDTTSSWEMLEFEIYFTLASGNAGCFYWAHDLGAFNGGFGTTADSELFTRWVQFGALSSSLRLHSDTDVDRRPWLWGKPFEDAMRKAYRLRSELFPYIYSCIRQCYDETLPLLRPMYLGFPELEEAYACKTQYMLGQNILVAPITTAGSGSEYKANRAIWLPDGMWFNFTSGEKFAGGHNHKISANLDEIPLYVRGGTPIAMQPYTPKMTTAPLSTLVVRCYPGPDGNSTLYEDDGRSLGYQNGVCAHTKLYYRNQTGGISVRIDATEGIYSGQLPARGYRIELPATDRAKEARVNGEKVSVNYVLETEMNVIEISTTDIRRPLEVVVRFMSS